MASPFLPFTTERIEAIYEEILGLTIELSKDPTVEGTSYLQRVISECRNGLNRTAAILIEISRDKRRVKNELAGAESSYDIREADLLANDPTVMRGPNLADRKARVQTILREEVLVLQGLRGSLRNLEDLERAVRIRHDELVRTDGMIKTQRNLLRDEVQTGSFYGDENPAAPGSASRKETSDDLDEAEIERLLEKTPFAPPAESPTPQAETTPQETLAAPASPGAFVTSPTDEMPLPDPPVLVSDAEAIDTFFGNVPAQSTDVISKPSRAKKAVEKPKPKVDDDFDIDSILDQIS
jgi:hypothetical protein